MNIDQETKVFLDKHKIMNLVPLKYVPLWLARTERLGLFGYKSDASLAKIENIIIPGPHGPIPLRIYTPHGTGPFPVVLAIHGGGWIIGSVDNYDGFCHELSSLAEVIVVSVEYRRAPEYKFPIPFDDCYAAFLWVADTIARYNGDPRRIVVGGESAGGNLTAAVALKARDTHGPHIVAQLLIYPVTDYACDTVSHKECGQGYLLRSDNMRYMWDLYLNNKEDQNNSYASVLRAKNFTHLPPALVIIAEFDPLRDEGYAYAQKLQEANVKTMVVSYPTIHAFLNLKKKLNVSSKGMHDIVLYLKNSFSAHE